MKSESKVKTILTLNCEQASRLLSEKQDVPLVWWQRLALRLHLLICRSCRRYNQQLQFIRTLFRAIAGKDTAESELTMSEKKREEIKKALTKSTDS